MPARPMYVLIVDDEPDIHAVTRLTLRSMRYHGKRLKFISAHSGAEALEAIRKNPNIAVILLDVIMETEHAGLEVCQFIRNEMKNSFVRILLRTGQPGKAPERETIQNYDIDNYLAKAALTSDRLFVSVRTALKAFEELRELDRHRRRLDALHECSIAMRSNEPLDALLSRILTAAQVACPSYFCAVWLQITGSGGDQAPVFTYTSHEPDALAEQKEAEAIRAQIEASPSEGAFADGWLLPIQVHHEMGRGWLYLKINDLDPLEAKSLELVLAYAANTLYSLAAQGLVARPA